MARSVLLRCPVCRREHRYVPPEYPCACGAPVTLPVAGDGAPVRVAHRSWADAWTELECPACGRSGHWPCPGFDCACGAMVRLTPAAPRVAGPAWDGPSDDADPHPEAGRAAGENSASEGASSAKTEQACTDGAEDAPPDAEEPPAHEPPEDGVRPASRAPGAPGSSAAREFAQGRRAARGTPGPADDAAGPGSRRGPFRPLTIRTGYDAVACAAHFLRWLGFAGVRTAVPRTASGLDLRGPSVVGLVNATTAPTEDGELEVLWLHGQLGSALPVAFSLAGYGGPARTLADRLRLPLFVLDLSGTPQPVNQPGEALLRDGVEAEP
ncbi:hypothetical protein [Streptomyces sedi]|uniref:hypothetical protein n=1 Tax=Streptomyces sedi TaxID=555059 RepID=UPI001FE4B4ED|nr:hypothetical protein [Streptomyces sedi]